jgi:hypothetical protein
MVRGDGSDLLCLTCVNSSCCAASSIPTPPLLIELSSPALCSLLEGSGVLLKLPPGRARDLFTHHLQPLAVSWLTP